MIVGHPEVKLKARKSEKSVDKTQVEQAGGTVTCQEYDNTATITQTGPMGFWQNKNGQGIVTGGASTGGVCNSGTWLRQFNPFQDLSASATCAQVATYVYIQTDSEERARLALTHNLKRRKT